MKTKILFLSIVTASIQLTAFAQSILKRGVQEGSGNAIVMLPGGTGDTFGPDFKLRTHGNFYVPFE